MELNVITDYRKINKKQWAQFVRRHPQGNVFHTPEMVELYEISSKQEPLVIASFGKENEMTGILIALVIREYNGFLGSLTSRAIVWGGPLVIETIEPATPILLAALDKLCKKKVVFCQFRNLWDMNGCKSLFEQKNYHYEEHLDILFDLNLGEEALWKAIHPTRRKQINRGFKREIQTKIVDILQPSELMACYAILKQVYREVKLPYPDFEYFKNANQLLGKKGITKAILAMYNEEIVGFRMFLCYKELLYDWYAGSRPEHYDKYPNDILPWEIMKWGISNGFKVFDFGGAGKPGIPYGVRDYKMKFGGELVNFGRFEKIHKPFAMILARIGFNIWKSVKL